MEDATLGRAAIGNLIRIEVEPVCEGVTNRQFYWPDTNVLVRALGATV